jgi:hypothetical protein
VYSRRKKLNGEVPFAGYMLRAPIYHPVPDIA